MERAVQIDVMARLLARTELAPTRSRDSAASPMHSHSELYRDREHLNAERAVLFRRLPVAVAHVSELAAPGDYVTRHVADVPVLLMRDGQGDVRAFINECRHRGAPLAHKAADRGCKTLVCPYHGWVYGIDGGLVHVPGAAFYRDLDQDKLGLVPLASTCAHGFVWLIPDAKAAPRGPEVGPEVGLEVDGALGPKVGLELDGALGPKLDLARYLGTVHDDLEHFEMASQRLVRKTERVRKYNWKLIVNAFLQGYHRQGYHRQGHDRQPSRPAGGDHGGDHDQAVVSDAFGCHLRSVGARENLASEAGKPREEWRLRACATPLYLLFPNTIVVVHAACVSALTMVPMAVDRTYCAHYLLAPGSPETPETPASQRHLQHSFELVEQVAGE